MAPNRTYGVRVSLVSLPKLLRSNPYSAIHSPVVHRSVCLSESIISVNIKHGNNNCAEFSI